jgi:hypothetical protein
MSVAHEQPGSAETASKAPSAAPPVSPFEAHVRAAQKAIKAGQTPSQIKASLLATGVDPLTAETAYRTARRRLFDANRLLGAKLAAYAIAALCGGTLLFVPLGWTVPLAVVLIGGLLLMGIATLVWLTGLGADEP